MRSSIFSTLRFIVGHPLARKAPMAAIWRYFSWQLRSRITRRPIVCKFAGGTHLVVERGMTGATGNVYCGLHEFEDMAFIAHYLRPTDFFVDVGANVGSYTVLAAGVAGASVMSFEPDSLTYHRLVRNLD